MVRSVSRSNPPRLRLADPEAVKQARRATWLELFSDLVFVVAVAELASLLAEEVSAGRMVAYAALFVPVWWAWTGQTFYANRFDSDDTVHRVLTLAKVLGVSVLAATIHNAIGPGSAVFALAYAGVRCVLVASYARAWIHVVQARPLIRHYILGFSLALSLWVASVAVAVPGRYAVWVVAMVIDLGTALTARRHHGALPPQPQHLPERFGLFVVIVLGESISSIVRGLADANVSRLTFATATAGVVIAFGIWWLYFDNLEESVVLKTLVAGQVWVYSHLALLIAVAATGVGIETGILHVTLNPAERWLIGGSVATSMIVLAILHLCSGQRSTAVARLIGAAFCLGLTAPAFSGNALFLLSVLALIVAAQVAAETVAKGRSDESIGPAEPIVEGDSGVLPL
jgi:low temperature requirement protein LtrA